MKRQSRIDNRIIYFYTKEKLSLRAIAGRTSISHETVRNILLRNGVPLRARQEEKQAAITVNEIITLRSKKVPIAKIAVQAGISNSGVSRRIKKYTPPQTKRQYETRKSG